MTLLTEMLAEAIGVSERGPALLPLDAGEQYRFSFDMGACIGCHSCEVACAEQNGNPVGVNWRRVGEIEGGQFPDTKRFNLSTACNHCLEPTCLSGCPTNAYVKLENGVVAHHAEDCIGCQYCIWNCPYEVPVFNPERRVVTKCDMCLPRLESGGRPACVDACPTSAITVEKVSIAGWRADHSSADGPGLPPSRITLSTTRIVLPDDMPAVTRTVVDDRDEPADPHWPLIALTLLTQAALGAVSATVALQAVAQPPSGTLGSGAVAAFVAGALALGASILHLGRPAAAWKALRNLRHSWLSREVALFSAFSAISFVYAGAWLVLPGTVETLTAGAVAVALGIAGVYASGRLYLVPARPVWNSARTPVSFFATVFATGPLLALAFIDRSAIAPSGTALLLSVAAAGSLGQLAVTQHLVASIVARHEREYAATARLLFGRFRAVFAVRVGAAMIAVGLCAWAAVSGSTMSTVLGALLVAGAAELAGRYLFFVTVTPMTAARRFSAGAD